MTNVIDETRGARAKVILRARRKKLILRIISRVLRAPGWYCRIKSINTLMNFRRLILHFRELFQFNRISINLAELNASLTFNFTPMINADCTILSLRI